MKRTYTKPAAFFENYALSANIATACGNIITNATPGACGLYYPSIGYIFVSGQNLCTMAVYDGFGNLCYDVPTGNNTIFTS
jgi:hypothetical protein